MKLKDKVAIVTGGASGIGLAITKRFLDEGARVVVASQSEEKFKENLENISASFIQTDVKDEESIKNLIAKVLEQFSKIDIVINNAGVDWPPQEDISEYSIADFRKLLQAHS